MQEKSYSWGERFSHMLTSPIGVLILIPLLVGSVGGFMAFNGQWRLQATVNSMVQDRFAEQTQSISQRTGELLQQAGPLLDRWRDFFQRYPNQDPPRRQMVLHLSDLMANSPDVSWLSYGREKDGLFLGVFRRKRNGPLVFTDRRIGKDGKTLLRNYHVKPDGSLQLYRTNPDFRYDVRKRPYYKLGKKKNRRVWTSPYIFFDSGLPGITCMEPVRDPKGMFAGIVTIDFHLNGLSQSLERLKTQPGQRTFIFNSQHILIAYAGVTRKVQRNAKGRGKPLQVSDHSDPLLVPFFQNLARQASKKGLRTFAFDHAGESILGAVIPCQLGQDLDWYVGVMAPKTMFMKPAQEHRRAALRIALIALFVALFLAGLFASHLVRSRQVVKQAKKDVEAAQKKALELGSYTLVHKIGQGTAGEVWKAQHRMLARPAAIKLIRLHQLRNKTPDDIEEALHQFEREAQITASLSSVNTVKLYDFGVSEDGTLFYVMELLEGLNLYTLVKRYGPQPLGRVIHILLQICASLSEAHDKGLVHRDLKPANIFLCAQGTDIDVVKVLDFGIAWNIFDTQDGTENQTPPKSYVTGTPAYMAPEQIANKSILDARTDIYALGCLGYWLLTGRRVFQRSDLMTLLEAHLRDVPAPPSQYSPQPIPKEFDQLILKCLAKRSNHRPADAEAMAQSLREIEIPSMQQWEGREREDWWREHVLKESNDTLIASLDDQNDDEDFSHETIVSLHEMALSDTEEHTRTLIPQTHKTLRSQGLFSHKDST